MLWRTLPWVLETAGIAASEAQLLELKQRLWVTKQKAGRLFYELI
jgi:hypothetical protein